MIFGIIAMGFISGLCASLSDWGKLQKPHPEPGRKPDNITDDEFEQWALDNQGD